jgi:outer membrane usher protein
MRASSPRNSRLKTSADGVRDLRFQLLASCATLFAAGAACAQPGVTPQAQTQTVPAPTNVVAGPAPQRLNPTGKPILLTVPVKDGSIYLGDIALTIGADDSLTFSSQRLIDLLSNILDAKIVETLRGSLSGRLIASPQDLAGSGVQINYNPQTLDLTLNVPSQMRASRAVQISSLDRNQFGSYAKPATVSAYMNIRGSTDYVEQGADTGWGKPTFYLDGAARFAGVVLESQQIWQPGAGNGGAFQRQGTRLVWDDVKDLARWTLGDLQPVARGFQSAPDMAGISIFRSYSVLEPQLIARPRGDRTFVLDRASSVEVYVNGQLVRRLQLAPGTFNLKDFPFTQGANDVRLSILDDSGRSQTLRFNLFLDQSQLGKGLSEFGFYAGVKSPLGLNGPQYSDQWQVSGFYRRGISDSLTLGGNLQADRFVQMGGLEAVMGTPLGVFATNLAASSVSGYGSGYAATITYQRLIPRRNGQSDSVNLSFETRSIHFGAVGTVVPSNPYAYEFGAGYSHSFTDAIYAGADFHYSKGRDGNADVQNYRGTVGWRVTPTISMTTDLLYESNQTRRDVAALISLTMRLGRYSSVRADYDTRENNTRLSYQTLHGEGVGSYNVSADVERTDGGSGFNLTANYVANRAELGVSQFSSFNGDFSAVADQRTSLRFGASIAFADGAFSIGRPIYDAFAVVVPFKTLKGASVTLDPTPYGYQATTGLLDAATQPNIAAYNQRTITVDAPNAPAGVDIGQGSFRLFPGYRGGYRLQVGSEYYVTAIGRLIGEDGAPLSLISGKATELAHPDHEPIVVFTNRDGRFGIAGLRPGRWRIEMLSDPATTYLIDIPTKTDGAVRIGDVKPTNGL